MDLHENPEANTVTASFELPGLTKDKVNIDVHNNRLTVSGEVEEVEDMNQDGYAIKERRSGKFSRSVALPERTQVRRYRISQSVVRILTEFHSLILSRLPWRMES
jgi:HSP20 family protein